MKKLIITENLEQDDVLPLKVGLEWSKALNLSPALLHISALADDNMINNLLPLLNYIPEQEHAKAILEACEIHIQNKLKSLEINNKDLEISTIGSDLSKELVKVANSDDVDLVVIGHNDKKFLSKLFLGRNTERLVHKSKKPIRIVKDEKAIRPKKF